MKKIIIPVSALLLTGFSYAQTTPSSSENYIYTKTYLSDPTLSNLKTSETIQYFDGLGRPKQLVNVKASPTGKDVVQHIEYDGFGRQVKNYLPIPQSGTQNGAIYPDPKSSASVMYGTEKIFSESILESSPLDRVLQQIQVGNDWTQKPVKFNYEANSVEDQVRNYQISTTWDNVNKMFVTSSIQASQFYPAAQLYKNTVIDEDGNKTIEFKNAEEQTILIRKVVSTSENADTYYVYNEYSQLMYTIPPLASKSGLVDQVTLDNLCYQYRHDGKYKLVEKKLPGKGWEFMVYDKQDRLVAVQDANLRAKGQWQYTKYDQFGRVAITGIATGSSRISEQNMADGLGSNNVTRLTGSQFNRQGMDVFYGNQDATYPNSTKWVTLLSLNYYDTYPAYIFNPAFPSTILGKTTLTDNPVNNGKSTNSLPVMSFVKNIEDDNWTKNYHYYDTKGREIGSYSINHLGGYTKTETELDFAGLPKQTKTYHKRLNTDTEKVITETFEYDAQNRVKKQYHQVGSQPQELLAENTYNELSQLSNKKVGNNLQSIDYYYNIRGWLTKINDPANLAGKLFGYEIKYNNPVNTSSSTGKYNGNIAEVDWRTSQDAVLRRYNYGYDALNRLQNGIYSEPNASIPQNNYYNETLSYDLNGNITSLQRNAKGQFSSNAELIDNLTYAYTGNRLNTVTDISANYRGYPDTSGNTISYDDNGNMKDHVDKGILQIDYNFLNLPKYIKFNEYVSSGRDNKIYVNTNYQYRADGVKIRRIHNYKDNTQLGALASKSTDYIDGFQYEYDWAPISGSLPSDDFILKFVPTTEGYYNFENNKYIYSYTDHLGNVRLSYFKNSNGSAEVLEENNYYPFGMKHEGYNALVGNPAYKYQYNGKEYQTETGWYDCGARFYMPDIVRTPQIDPLAEKMSEWSPYSYAFNNPIKYTDPDGRKPFDWILQNINGVSTWTYNANVKTVAQAEAAGYKNVAAIYSYANISGEGFLGSGKYSYSLNTNGSVTDNLNGNVLGGDFSTPAGTNISTGAYAGLWDGGHKGIWGDWGASDSFLGSLSYNVANSFYLGFQVVDTFNLMGGKHTSGLTGQQVYSNLDGSNQYNEGDRALAFTSTFNPLSSELKVAGVGQQVLPKTSFKMLDNATNASKLLKGTSVSNAAPATRSNIYKYLNKGVNTINTASMFKTGATSIIKPLSQDKHKN